MSSHASFLQTFGLFEKQLGSLPTEAVWQHMQNDPTSQLSKQLDITEVLSALGTMDAGTLSIRVPTVGFVDLLFAFDAEAGFAIPVAIDGKLSSKTQPLQADVIVYDLKLNAIALPNDAIEKTSYSDLLQSLSPQHVFSTLKFIEFRFDLAQWEKHDTHELSEYKGKLNLLLPNGIKGAYPVDVTVLDSGGQTQFQTEYLLYPDGAPTTPMVQLTSEPSINQNLMFDIKVDSMLPSERIQLQVDFTLDGVKKHAQQYFGLSQAALSDVVSDIVFGQNDPMAVAKTFSTSMPHVNVFPNSELAQQFVSMLTEGIVLQNVPLASMHTFIDMPTLDDKIQAFDVSHWDQHDQQVWQLFSQNVSSEEGVFDDLEGLFHSVPSQLHSHIPLAEDSLIDDVQVRVVLEQGDAKNAYQFQPSLSQVGFELGDDQLLHFDPTTIDHLQGKTFTIHPANELKNADIIEGFSFARQDKIDLTALLDNLNEQGYTELGVEARQTDTGDTQIWVTHQSASVSNEPIHVATIVGASSEKGNLPDDLNWYIDDGGL